MAWRRPGDKPLSEPMRVKLLTHICVTRPQWVDYLWKTFGTLKWMNIHPGCKYLSNAMSTTNTICLLVRAITDVCYRLAERRMHLRVVNSPTCQLRTTQNCSFHLEASRIPQKSFPVCRICVSGLYFRMICITDWLMWCVETMPGDLSSPLYTGINHCKRVCFCRLNVSTKSLVLSLSLFGVVFRKSYCIFIYWWLTGRL